MSDKPSQEEEVQLNRFGLDDVSLVMTRRVDYDSGEITLKIGPGFVLDNTQVIRNGRGQMARQDSWVHDSVEFVTHSLNEILERQKQSHSETG